MGAGSAGAGRCALLLIALVLLRPQSARGVDDAAPCVDGVVSGDVGDFYQQLLDEHAAAPGGSSFGTLPAEMQAMVLGCAGRSGPDLGRYELRQVVAASESPGGGSAGGAHVLARIYDYLDPDSTVLCDGARGGACAEARYYYVAVVLSGCWTDNVFGAPDTDATYLGGAGWSAGHDFPSLRTSDRLALDVACEGDPGIELAPLVQDLIGFVDANGIYHGEDPAPTGDPAATDWRSRAIAAGAAETGAPGGLPAGFRAASSAMWNMTFSRWDPSLGGARPSEATWRSPAGLDPAVLCDSGGCDLGYASSGWDATHLWEWQVVYELRWDVSPCDAFEPSRWRVAWNDLTHASPAKPGLGLCSAAESLGRITVLNQVEPTPGNPWTSFRFTVEGPTPESVVLQDPGAAECTQLADWSACGASPPWELEDRVTLEGMIATDGVFADATYRIVESAGPDSDISGYATTWECKNIDPGCAARTGTELGWTSCPEVAPSCSSHLGPGLIAGTGSSTEPFGLCGGDHVICLFTNSGGVDECLEAQTAVAEARVLGHLGAGQTSLTTAAVPVPEPQGQDSVFFSSFIPVADDSRWPGSVRRFIEPLPLVEDADGALVPDQGRTCVSPADTGCLAWDTAATLLDQAPERDRVATDRQIGIGVDERRVTYTQAGSPDALPRPIRAFDYEDSDPIEDERDLWRGMGIDFVAGDAASEALARSRARRVVRETLRQRIVTLAGPAAEPVTSLRYVLGDVGHAPPVLLAGPSRFFYLLNDLEGNGATCDSSNANTGYRCFFERHRRRRRVLVAASNDGQLHGFDAGRLETSPGGDQLSDRFDYGSGREIFAHIPRQMLEHTRRQVTGEHEPGLDGPLLVDDVFLDPVHDGIPSHRDREWRTVLFGTYREGGRGLYALDLTQPDPLEQKTVAGLGGKPAVEFRPRSGSGYVPGCSALRGSLPAGCEHPYPMVLWEFTDQCGADSGLPRPCDEDGNGLPDLGFSWSKPNSGRVLVKAEGESDPVVKFVAIFGGGLDPDHEGGVGNFLYMVDVETGKAIYKRQLAGSAAAEPAAVDTDQDGLLDTIYIGTTAGLLYKVDISRPADLSAQSARLDDLSQWAPFPIFSTEGRPIFFRPTVIFEATSGHFGVGFGTGDREDLWSEAAFDEEGRFYLVLDRGLAEGMAPLAGGPLSETSFEQIDVADQAVAENFLTTPAGSNQPGWVLRLRRGERVVSDAFALSGLLAFTTFEPEPRGDCALGGRANAYRLLATNANPIGGPGSPRATAVDGFAGATRARQAGRFESGDSGPVSPADADSLAGIRSSLMHLFPAACRFGTFSVDVTTSAAGTRSETSVRVPVCIAPWSWTEIF